LRKKKPKSESPTAKPKGVDTAEMADKERQAIVEDGRKIPARSGYQVTHPVRVRSHNEGKAGREENWQTVRRATKTYSAEDGKI
jgi:hypothetical protein